MRKKVVYILSITIGAAVLIIGSMMLYGWLNRPLPIPLDDPNAQPIKDVLVKSHKIEHLLSCNPESDVNMLDEVYKDTADYKQSSDDRVMIAKYLGKAALNRAGYLSFLKAYHLWERSGDLYPRASPDPTRQYLATVAPTSKPIRECPNPPKEPELQYQSIAIRDDRAVVIYDYGPYLTKAILRRVDGVWFIVSSRNLAVNV